ncbi:ABC transporter permease [Dinghuibacter silviterrae]|uniref:ABC-type antimicrobial peptide transport system permease subunit n=1 Tax=Dinghuibacter silviterrae TaxID=1539049 RepID=A0A4R8DPC0_9BACT|nr:ABC transporter permease [Dinghuibacter silviterrae]TDW99565.1 ABC-type antimicrobial peptide transport system permease subunit [Dinghuibacter silviterrae]
MVRSYLHLAWRNLLRTKGYSILNILGLSIGMTVALLIGLWVHYEYSYDRFLPQYKNIYQVARNFNNNGETLTFGTCSLKLADVLKARNLEIAETDYFSFHGLKAGDRKFEFSGGQVKENFIGMFGFPLVKGNPGEVFRDPFSIVLTQQTATALFGSEDPIGKTVRIDNQHDVTVTGILKDLPANCSFDFKYLLPFSFYEAVNPYVKQNRAGGFGQNGYQIFARVNANVEKIRADIKDVEKTEKGNINAMKSDVILQPMREWHLYGDYQNGKPAGGMIDYVRMFSIIGILVLAIACINFVNLETARSERRAREVGVRKAIGSRRTDLILQFLTESVLLTLFAFGGCIILTTAILPAFNALADAQIRLPLASPAFWGIVLGAALVTALVSGARPALYLSSFQPVQVLKGLYKTGHTGTTGRKVLVVIQFTCSIALIVSTIIIYQQLRYTQNRPTGYDANRLLSTRMNADLAQNYTALRDALRQDGIADDVTASTSPATDIYWHSDVDKWPGKYAGETVEMGCVGVMDDYLKTLGISMSAGRDFAGPADSLCVLLNEAAVRRLRLKNPVGQVMTWQGTQVRIIGIARNTLQVSPFAAPQPTLYFKTGAKNASFLLYRLSPRISTRDAVDKMTALFNRYEPTYPYEYTFVDQAYARKFDLEILIGRLAGILAVLAILISCLGLLGLAAYMAEQRTKEIGIRKVLGATVPQVWFLLSRDFILLVLISCLVASPLAFYFLRQWLLKYDYRISIQPIVFITAGAAALVITLITTSFQSIRAAHVSPAKSLKTE